MADIDFERALEAVGCDLVGAEQDHQLRLGLFDVGDATLLRIAEQQAGYPCRSDVQHVETVPAILDERLGGGQRRTKSTLAERTRPNDHHRPFGILDRVGRFLGQLGEQRQIIAQPFDLVGQIDFGPDREHLRPAANRLADAGVDQRRFPAGVRSNQQHHVGVLDLGDRRVEPHRGERCHVIVEPGLTPFEHGRSRAGQQRLRGVHRLGVEQVAGDRRDLLAGLLEALGEQVERVAPARFLELALAIAHPRPIEPVPD